MVWPAATFDLGHQPHLGDRLIWTTSDTRPPLDLLRARVQQLEVSLALVSMRLLLVEERLARPSWPRRLWQALVARVYHLWAQVQGSR